MNELQHMHKLKFLTKNCFTVKNLMCKLALIIIAAYEGCVQQ